MYKMIKAEKNPDKDEIIVTARKSDGTIHKFYPLPGNIMDFGGSIPEEVNKEGRVIMANINKDVGGFTLMPRRGLSEKCIANISKPISDIVEAFAESLAAEIGDEPIPEDG